MSSSKLVGSYVLDTLQIYFSWDDDLYTHLKDRGLGQGGMMSKKLPLIYTDNCESTTGVHERSRKYVITPEYFGITLKDLGWKPTERKTEPIIASEKPKVDISLVNNGKDLEFRIRPRIDGKEEYHLEYSSMSAFGRLYTNWSIIVLTIKDFHDLLRRLRPLVAAPATEFVDVTIHKEKKQAQRETLRFVEIPVKSYKFSIGEFSYARKYFELNGVAGTLPSLVFKDEPSYREIMDPVLKVGFVHTTEKDGFEVRKPQCAMKLAQPKITITERGKRGKVKGRIVVSEAYENYFTVPAKEFLILAQAINQRVYKK